MLAGAAHFGRGVLDAIGDVGLEAPNLDHRQVRLVHLVADAAGEVPLELQVGIADRPQRVLEHRKRLRLRDAVGGEPHLVIAGQHGRAILRGAPQDHAGEGHDARGVEVPREAIQAGGHGRSLRSAREVVIATSRCSAGRARRIAINRAHDLTLGIEEVEGQRLGLRLQVIAHDRPIQATRGVGRLEDRDVGQRREAELAQRGDVVHHVEAAAVRANGQGIVFHHQVSDRHIRQAVGKLLPLLAIVIGDVDAVLRAGVEQAAADRILAHGVHVIAGRDAVDDLRPGLAVVLGAEDVRRAVAEQHLLHRHVGGAVVERRAVKLAHAAQVRHGRRRDVDPGLAVVTRDVDHAIV